MQRIEAWHDSGLSQKVWCRQNGVRPSQPGYWKKKLWAGSAPASSSNTRTAFVPVSLAQRQDQTGQAPSVLTVSLPNPFDGHLYAFTNRHRNKIKCLFEGFSGYLQTDGYASYSAETVEKLEQLLPWAVKASQE
ncbi:IS66 family insertion sequence element accessory protein TnpA [Endozoicomonas acroporae]|uniref:IS66 family insertion sequence element accessory protein TnpA n=1 Tax=Endozoicomonas acroporae TaxID=1701104 RepID=UPI003B82CFC7